MHYQCSRLILSSIQVLQMTKQKVQKQESVKRKQPTKSKNIKKKSLQIKSITKNELRQLVSTRFKKETINKPIDMSEASAENSQKSKLFLENVVPLIQKDNLNCPICLDYCIYPVLTQCGHYYCLSCFQNAHKRSQNCCVCRNHITITEYQPSDQLQKLFEECIRQKVDWSEAVLYQSRLEQAKNKQMKRKIPQVIDVGDKVDYKMLRCWVEAKIISISESQIKIKYQNPANQNSQIAIINKNSRLLAAHRFFSIAKEIKKQEKLPNQVQRFQVLPGEQIRQVRAQQPERPIPVRRQQPEPHVQAVRSNPQVVNRQNNQDRDRNWQIIVMNQTRTFNMWFAQQLQHSFTWQYFDVNSHREDNDQLLEL